MVQTTEILKILHGMQHDLQAIDQKRCCFLTQKHKRKKQIKI